MSANSISTLGMTGSYNENSDPQLAIIYLMTSYIQLGVDVLDVSSNLPLTICDFGSSQGKNSILRMKLLQEDKTYQGVASGISFYEQCLPLNTLSMDFTTSSLRWLSKIPFNLSNHCFHTYGSSDEGRKNISNYFDTLYVCAQRLFTSEELSKFTIPNYLRSINEYIDYDLFERCSLELVQADTSKLNVPTIDLYKTGQITFDQLAKIFTKVFQSKMDTLVLQISQIFGRSKEQIDLVSQNF